jgi:hypothetical protein
MSFEEFLKEKFRLKDEDLKKALLLQRESSLPLPQILVSLGLVSEEQLIRALAQYLNLSVLEETLPPDEELFRDGFLDGVNLNFLIERKCLPFKVDKTKKVLFVATSNPYSYEAFNYLTNLTGFRIKPLLCFRRKT